MKSRSDPRRRIEHTHIIDCDECDTYCEVTSEGLGEPVACPFCGSDADPKTDEDEDA